MATHDYIINNDTGSAVRADLNAALAAIASNNASATAPSTTYAYQWWVDTTTSMLKLRNGSNSDWILIASLSDVPIACSATTDAINMNPSTISAAQTIPSGYNAYSAGPLTIGEGVEITINDNANWSIL